LAGFHGTVKLDTTCSGRDAGTSAEALVQHWSNFVRAEVEVRLEIHAYLPHGAPEHIVRTVTETYRTPRSTSAGFQPTQGMGQQSLEQPAPGVARPAPPLA
jgi:hypothetical protein